MGSFICSCNTGYDLTLDGKNCTGELSQCILNTYMVSVKGNCNAILKLMILMGDCVVCKYVEPVELKTST